MGFYFLADFWRVEFMLDYIRPHIKLNMSNKLLVDAWCYNKPNCPGLDVDFSVYCEGFIKNDPDFKPELLLRTIQKLDQDQFISMMDALVYVNRIESRLFVKLILKWLRKKRNENSY